MENDVNNVQPITEQASAPAATAQGVTPPTTAQGVQQPATAQTPSGGQTEQAVPYARFKEVNDAANQAKAEVENLKLQMQIFQSQQAQKTPEQVNLFEQICKEKGYTEDYLTKAQQAEVTQEVVNRQVSQVQAQIQIQTFMVQHPDYAEVVGVNDALGNFHAAPPLARQLQKNPLLAQAILQSPHRHLLAYQIAKSDPEYLSGLTKAEQTTAIKQAEQILSNPSKMQSISSVPGAGNTDKAAMIRGMSDAEFAKYKAQVMAKA